MNIKCLLFGHSVIKYVDDDWALDEAYPIAVFSPRWHFECIVCGKHLVKDSKQRMHTPRMINVK